jgi:hypothetical protein
VRQRRNLTVIQERESNPQSPRATNSPLA